MHQMVKGGATECLTVIVMVEGQWGGWVLEDVWWGVSACMMEGLWWGWGSGLEVVEAKMLKLCAVTVTCLSYTAVCTIVVHIPYWRYVNNGGHICTIGVCILQQSRGVSSGGGVYMKVNISAQ